MKLYTVWSGEYSDRGMHAIFKSEEKAKKYAEIHEQLDSFGSYYIIEYELEDDKFDINTKVAKYYYCSISTEDRYGYEGVLIDKKGEITTDELWDGFMEQCDIERYEDLDPIKYNRYIQEELFLDPEEVEEDYALPIEIMIEGPETSVNVRKGSIDVYSKRGYHVARKVALDKYYQLLAKEEGLC